MGRAETGNGEVGGSSALALAGWGIPKGAPVPEAFGPASPSPPPTGMQAGLENAGFSAAAQGSGYPGHEGGGRDGGREEVTDGAVGKGSDSLLLPQTLLLLGTRVRSAS